MAYFRLVLAPAQGHHARAVADCDELAHALDLDRGGFADDLMREATDGILWNMIQELDPDGVPWAPLDPTYAAEKAIARPGKPMAVYDTIMRTVAQLEGRHAVGPDLATQSYGTGDPVALYHAVCFTEGGVITGTSQPPRPFYAFTTGAIAAMDAVADARFAAAVP